MNANSMTPVDWAKRPITEKYADFTGRAPRAEYWWYILGLIVVAIVISIVESVLGLKGMILGFWGPLTALFMLATIVPSLAVGARRLHDTNRSGWWQLLFYVPYALMIILGGAAIAGGAAAGGTMGAVAGAGIAGLLALIALVCGIILLVFMVLPSQPGENRYGPNPSGGGADATVAAE
jgi:uncharacterized membrane protein YhaH (DUF805 family)